jgi:putative heme-binding domain-containing protein
MLSVLVLMALQGTPLVAETEPLSPEEQQKRFKLPPGFEIQLVAAEPDVVKPMNLSFDDRGRLLVTQSYEYPFPAKANPRDTVRILRDFGPDGRARKVGVYADGLNIPIGVTATSDGAFVYGIPKVYRMKGEEKAESREELFGDAGFNDTHGMLSNFTPWIDGWIYACHGFANRSDLKAKDGSRIQMHSGNTWRMKADGSGVQQYTHGQVNPFGLCFDPLGNLYSADCHSMPAYQLLRGAWYPTFDGKHDGLGHGPRLLDHQHGSTGIAGIIFYAAVQFPEEYRNNLFIGNPVTGKINLDRLERNGASYRAIERPDFLTCSDPWFRPVDIELAPDGSLYVADFYNCIIGHYEVPLTHPKRDRTRGRIWRIVHKDGPQKPLADFAKASEADLVAALADETIVNRIHATNRLVERKADAAVKLDAPNAWSRAHGLWVHERLGKLDEGAVRRLAADSEGAVRTHLWKALGERKTWTYEGGMARSALADSDAWVRRAAAEALGLHPDAANVKPLAMLWEKTDAKDPHLIHVARIALRNQLLLPGAVAGLDGEHRDRIADVLQGAPTPDAAKYLLAWMKEKGLKSGYLRHVVRHLPADLLPQSFEVAAGLKQRPPGEQIGLLRSLQQALQERGAAVPPAFTELAGGAVKAALGDGKLREDALKLAREMRLAAVYEDVLALARSQVNAVDALPALDASRCVKDLAALVGDEKSGTAIRQRGVAALAGVGSPDARKALLELLRVAPSSMSAVLAGALAANKEGADALLTACEEGKAAPRVLNDATVRGRLQASKPRDWEARAKKLTADLPAEDERVKGLLESRRKGYRAATPNAERGREIFTKTCAGCHKKGELGQKVGPELDGVATRGLDRLLEDVLDPNRAVDQAFRSSLIRLKNGEIVAGLVMREEGEVIVVKEGVDKETRVALKDIEARVLSQLSPMPANITEPLSEPDFYDLLSFLLR